MKTYFRLRTPDFGKAVLLSAILLTSGAQASDVVAGAFAPEVAGARPLGMGGAFAAMADDGNAVAENPAGLALFPDGQKTAAFTHSALFGITGLSRDFLSYGQADAGTFGAVGMAWNRLSADFSPEQYAEDSFMASWAKRLSSKDVWTQYAIGVTAKYLQVSSGFSASTDNVSVGGASGSGWAADAGLMVKFGEDLGLALVGHDLYSTVGWNSGTNETNPMTLDAAAAYTFLPRATVAGQLEMWKSGAGFDPLSWHLGAEYWVLDGQSTTWEVFRNFGFRTGYQQQFSSGEQGIVSAGLSAKADRWQLDYAYQLPLATDGLGVSHRFGVSFSL
jgi:hypothetical protein